MTCETALLLISGHLDRENTAQEEDALSAHLEQCPQCRQVLEAFRQAETGLNHITAEVPVDFCDRVMDQIRRKASPNRKRAKWAAMGSLAAAIAVVMGICWYTLPGGLQAQQNVTDATVPMMARTLGETGAAYSSEAAVAVDPAELARQLGAPVVALEHFVEELENCGSEVMDDGSMLYLLETAQIAAKLGRKYEVMVYDPGTAAEISFALVRAE